MFVQNCLEFFSLVFTCLKMHLNSKSDQFLVGKGKISSKILPCCTGTVFSPKFKFDAKVQNIIF